MMPKALVYASMTTTIDGKSSRHNGSLHRTGQRRPRPSSATRFVDSQVPPFRGFALARQTRAIHTMLDFLQISH
jgi:hypothetical protein